MADETTFIPEENRSNILPSRIPTKVKAYYKGSQSMIFTHDIRSGGRIPNPDAPLHPYERLDYFDLNNTSYGRGTGREKILSWCDLYSWPKEGIRIQPPSLKENYVDIPGANGSLDFAEALTGYPLFQNHTGSINWEVDPYRDGVTIDGVMQYVDSFLHGRKVYALVCEEAKYIEDAYGEKRLNLNYEPWYYEGRTTVSSESLGESSPSWTLNYNFNPYKKLLWTTDQDFVWDNFDFENGISYKEIFSDQIVSDRYFQAVGGWIGTMPTIPTIKVSATSTQNQCRRKANLPELEGAEGSTLGLLFRVVDETHTTINPQDSGYIFVENNVNGITEPKLVMAGNGIYQLIDPATNEEISNSSIVIYAYGNGTFSIDMQIGVI